ncbi:MAG: GspH/FimT family pseudopilin [Gemmatimonadota bacterium]
MKRTGGFSMVELVIVLMVGGVLMGIAIPTISPVMNNFQARSAQNSFVSIVGKARAQAIERGTEVRFYVNMAGDSAWVEGDDGAYRFRDRNGVDLQSTVGSIEMIMTPRGFARGTSSSVTVRFVRGSAQSEVTLLPLGQVVF